MDRRIGLLLALGACAQPTWRNADLQIDVAGLTVVDEDRVRICVTGAGQRELAVGAGTMTFPGLPASDELEIVISLMEEESASANAGPTVLGGEASYAQLQWQECTASCSPCEDEAKGASSTANNRLLAVRFTD